MSGGASGNGGASGHDRCHPSGGSTGVVVVVVVVVVAVVVVVLVVVMVLGGSGRCSGRSRRSGMVLLVVGV